MISWMRCFIWILVLLTTSQVFAGLIEVSATGNYRRTSVDDKHYSVVASGTGSIAYYFWELSAVELSYTQGKAATIQPAVSIYTNFVMMNGAILVTFASKQSAFKPYLKAGGGYTIREISEEQEGFDPSTKKKEGFAPLGGAGFKLMLTEQFALKAGVDAYTTPLNDPPVVYDYAGYAGLSFMF